MMPTTTANVEKPEFSVEDLLRSLQTEATEDGWTTREICQKGGLPAISRNMQRIRRKVGDLVELGLWEDAGSKSVRSGGQRRIVPVYRPKQGISQEEWEKAYKLL